MHSPSKRGRGREASSISDVHRALADERRRRVLYHLVESGKVTTVDDLEEHLAERSGLSSRSVRITLHHSILPKLDECGVVDVDSDSDRVRYAGGSCVTELLEVTMHRERT